MRTRCLSHSIYRHQYHIVWGTKFRRKFLKPYVKPAFGKLLMSVVEKYPNLHVVSYNINDDHVHLQIEIPPNIAVSVVVQKIKWLTSLNLKKQFKFIKEMYLENSIWSVGYFSSTLGISETIIQKYIEYQGKKDVSQQIRLGFE
jgi:putative transposase